MTEDEKRLLIGQAGEELPSLKQHLACLKAKARNIQTEIVRANNVLSDITGREARDKSSPDAKRWPNYDEIASVHKDFHATTARIKEPENQFREWGIL